MTHACNHRRFEGGTLMKRITFLLVAIVALAGVVASMAPASGQAGQEAAPIFVTEIPPGYRDWRLISVAHEAGDLNDLRAILGNDVAIKAYREGQLSVPGRHHHCPARLELRRVGGKQPRLWPSPIIRGRAPQERAAVYGQGRKQIRVDGRLGVRSLRRRQTRRRGGAQHLLSLPRRRSTLATWSSPDTHLDPENHRRKA